jgi:hypothetical protein
MHGPDAPPDTPSWDTSASSVPSSSTPADGTSSTLGTPEPYDSGLTAPGYGAYGTKYGGGYGGTGGTYDTSPFAAWDAPPPVPVAGRRRSRLGLMTLSAAAVLAGGLLTLRAAGFEQVTVARILASVLVVLGAGMIVGTWVGRARWLLLPSLVVGAALLRTVGLQSAPVPYSAGVGERTWIPGPARSRRSFRLGARLRAELDWRQARTPAALDGPDAGGGGGLPVRSWSLSRTACGAGRRPASGSRDVDVEPRRRVRAGDRTAPVGGAGWCRSSSSSALPATPPWSWTSRSQPGRSRCDVWRHERDAVSLMAGLLVLLVGGLYLLTDLTGLALDDRWLGPAVLLTGRRRRAAGHRCGAGTPDRDLELE